MLEKQYIREQFTREEDEVLKSIGTGLEKHGFPQISVPPEVGKMLHMLVKISNASNILEIGALGGYSTIWMARALPEHGKIISLELKEEHAQFARENIAKAGLGERVELIVGDAMGSLNQLEKEQKRFDFFFIDADKLNYPNYLEKAIRLSNPGAVITADNLFLRGRVFDEKNQAPSPVTMRRFHQQMATDDRLESLILPLGDGLGVCRVKEPR
jgi:predicted O-methyltransferase YrrM